MTAGFTESVVEEAALTRLEELGYSVKYGPEIAASEPAAERSDPSYRDVLLQARLREALGRLNPGLLAEAVEDAHCKLLRVDAPSLLELTRVVQRMLVDGVAVEYRRKDGSVGGAQVRVIDFEALENNDWVAVNQFTVAERQHTRRPERIVQTINRPNRDTARAVVLARIGMKEVRSSDSRAYALLNEAEQAVAPPVADALRSSDVQPVAWISRESVRDELAA